MKKLKGLLFDLDGVITESSEYHFIAWKNLAKQIGVDIDRSFNEKLKGVSREESLTRILRHGGIETKFSDEEKKQLATQKNEEYVKLIDQLTPEEILPGISELLENAKAAGIKLGIASASKNAPLILERLGITKMFDTIVDPATLSAGKPDPEIFIKGAEQLGLKTDDCIGIEDAESGVQAINSANMFSIGVGSEEVLSHADYVVSSTAELDFDHIRELFEK